MKLQELFQKDINRPIRGVVDADDIEQLKNEVEEYVLTSDLARTLEELLDAYFNYQGCNGVWISGFFGSGKSHLLKMLSILLENHEFNGKKTADYFVEKTNDDILKGRIQSLVTIPSKSILFNIDHKAQDNNRRQEDSILRVFVNVFNESCGYNGTHAYLAQFERDLDEAQLLNRFKSKIQTLTNRPWEEVQNRITRYAGQIDEAYNSITDQNHKGILDKYRDTYQISIESFAEQVYRYIQSQPRNFRLNFYVDEVGQYIAANPKLMLNLQSIAECLNSKCKGKSWIFVTAQSDLDKVLGDTLRSINDDNASKIKDRFNIRINLNSAGVPEVIKKRLLEKKSHENNELTSLYDRESANFRTIFDFIGGQSYKNFENKEEFIQSYPFIPYQFSLLQTAIISLSRHDAFQGAYNSVGERSLLNIFQHVLIQLADQETGILASVDLMFDAIQPTLKTPIQQPIIEAQRNAMDPFSIRVLKSLALVKYIDSFKSSVRNIATLLYSSFDDNLEDLSKHVAQSLTHLEQESYIERAGDEYKYLTDKEKDVENEIKSRQISQEDVANLLQKHIFDDILGFSKIRHSSGNDYDFERKLDGLSYNRSQELGIHLISPLNANIGQDNGLQYAKELSFANSRDLVICLNEQIGNIIRDLQLYKKTNDYIRENNASNVDDVIRAILIEKSRQNADRLNRIKQQLGSVISESNFFIGGELKELQHASPKERIIEAFNLLVDNTYTNLKMLDNTEYDIGKMGSFFHTTFDDSFNILTAAEQEVLGYIAGQAGYTISTDKVVSRFSKIPYGWPLNAIICTIARLAAKNKIDLTEHSNILEKPELIIEALKNSRRRESVILKAQQNFSPAKIRKLKEFYTSFFSEPLSVSGADAKLVGSKVQEKIKAYRDQMIKLAAENNSYPFGVYFTQAVTLLTLHCKGDYNYYLEDTFSAAQDELLRFNSEVLAPLQSFIAGDGFKHIYLPAQNFLNNQRGNFSQLDSDLPQKISAILNEKDCFKGQYIQQLNSMLTDLTQKIECAVRSQREIVCKELEQLRTKTEQMPLFKSAAESTKQNVTEAFESLKSKIEKEDQIGFIRDTFQQFQQNKYGQLLETLTVSKEQKARIAINLRNLNIDYKQPIISNENELRQYLVALEQALKDTLKQDKIIQL